MNDQDHQLIEQYYSHELGSAEMAAFEQRLSSDPAFRAEAELYQQSLAAIRLYGREQFKKTLREISPPIPPATANYRWPLIATFIVLLAIMGGYWFLSSEGVPEQPKVAPNMPKDSAEVKDSTVVPQQKERGTPSPINEKDGDKKALETNKLFASAYRPFRESESFRNTERNNAPYEKMKSLYNAGNYRDALAAFDRLSEKDQGKFPAQFYKASSLLALGNAEEAISLFENVAASDSDYILAARWYAALCALKTGNVRRTENWLGAILKDKDSANDEWREKAKALQESIRQ